MGKTFKVGGERGRPKLVRPDREQERRACRRVQDYGVEDEILVDEQHEMAVQDLPSFWTDPENAPRLSFLK